MTTVHGRSDDLIEFEGEVTGEVNYIGEDDDEGCLLAFDDGTLLAMKYCKPGLAVWGISVLRKGNLFDRIEVCNDSEAKVYSDVAYFRSGMTRAWAAKEWEVVR